MDEKGVYVYIIAETYSEFRKIGVARDVAARSRGLQIGNPRPLQIEFKHLASSKEIACQIEHRAHKLLAADRLTGEWFSVPAHRALEAVLESVKWVKNRRGNVGCYDDEKRRQVNLGVAY